MDLFLSLCIGIGLSAACGFRIFVPLLVMSIAAKTGNLTLVPAFQWIGTDVALITFAVAPIIVVLEMLIVEGQSLLAVSAPLPVVATVAVATVVWCVFVLFLAARGRRVARRMRGRPFARPVVSSIAFWLGLCALVITALAAAIALLSNVSSG